MTLTPTAGTSLVPGFRPSYRWQDAAATYEPCSPYPSVARFGDGGHKTVYVADSAKGAMAEFFRRHPELIGFQEDLVIVLFELDLQIDSLCLDLTDESSRSAVGVSLANLTSSDDDETVRYSECRRLARACLADDLVGILYPSASATWVGAVNLVLFGEPSADTWVCAGHRPVDRPVLTASDIEPLP